MSPINPFAASGLLICGLYLPLVIFLFIKGRNKLTKIYAFHLLSVFLWGLGSFFIATSPNETLAYQYWKFALIPVVLIPVFFLHAVFIATRTIKPLLRFAYIQAVFFIIMILNSLPLKSIEFQFNSIYYYQGNTLYFIMFFFWEFIATFAHIHLIIYLYRNYPNNKSELACLFISVIGFIGGTSNFLPALGFYIYPYGNFLIPIHSFVITYSILKFQIFDISILVRKSVVYYILFTTVSIFYIVCTLISEKIIKNFLGYTSNITSIIIAFLIGFFLIPLRNKIQNYLDRVFFKTSYATLIDKHEELEFKITQTEKLKSIALFASGMAHEIKNPLTSIRTLCDYLPQKIHDKEFIDKFIPLVNKDVDRINELVHDLLDYAKPSPPDKQNTDIHKLIEGILDTLNSQIIPKKIKVDLNFDRENIQMISIDPKQIKQALLNIFLNAIESITSGGALFITTSLSAEKDKLNIQITDTGCGITKQDLPHIFDPFFTKKEQGTGLGLSITHGIIKEHGGKIFAESILGRGTTFRIELPLRKLT